MTVPRSLADLQHWMMSVLTAPGGVAAGLASDEARAAIEIVSDELNAVILPSQRLDALSRLQVYGDAYFLRLIECLGEDYPAVKAALGEKTFNAFAVEYLQRSPPRSYTLNDLGTGFPDFLHATKPTDEPSGGWADFLIDLARLERHYAQVFDGPGVEGRPPLTADDLSRVSADEWPACRLAPVPCLRLDTFQFPVHEYATAIRRGREAPAIPEAAATHLAITRRDFIVRRTSVGASEYELLSRIVAGETVGEAIAACAQQHEAELAEYLSRWFARWGAAGYFERIVRPRG